MSNKAMAPYPVVIGIPIAWGDMDAFQHVNNTAYFRYFESARIAYFERTGMMAVMKRDGIGPILAATSCRFRLPLTYPDTVSVGATALELGEDRFMMRYAAFSHRLGQIAAEGEGRIVIYDYRAQRKAAMPATLRAAIESVEAGGQRE